MKLFKKANSKLYALIFTCSLLLSVPAWSQTGLTLDVGLELGWWLHQLGAPEQGVFKTHHTGSPFVHLTYQWPFGRWRAGLSLRGGLFLEDDMRGPRDMRILFDRIKIAEPNKSIPFLRYGGQIGYELLRRGNYAFVPAIQYGSFLFGDSHPNRENFGYKQFTEILFTHIWKRPKKHWVLRMNYNTQRIFLRQKSHPLERHQLFSWGMSIGMGF